MREKVVERFLKYVTFDTTANPENSNCPSTEGQRVFANYLVEELKSLGLEDAHVDENSYVMATLKGNTDGVDTIGFISHLDTAPDITGKNVKPRIVENYDGSDIILTKDYFKYLLLIFILPIGFIVYLVKIFSKNESKNIKNLSKALLLFSFILVVAVGALYLIFTRIY